MTDWTTLFDGQLDVSPPLDEEALRQIPARRGVFALLAEGDRPIVLLTAAGIRARIRHRLQHPEPDRRGRTADLRQITRRILYRLTGGHFETDLLYLEIARTAWPGKYAPLLGWKPAWFVHVDPRAKTPHFARTRDPFAAGGRCLGPFPSGRDADAFIEAVQDGFDLCRDVRRLRQAPRAAACPYLQMNRCRGVCVGRISPEEYRQVMTRAAEFAAGRREERLAELTGQMKDAAARLEFEQAAVLKTRLDRLAALNAPAFRHVAPVEEFRFLMVQPGLSRRKARVFFVNGGSAAAGGDLDYPLKGDQVETARRAMSAHGPADGSDDAAVWRAGLVARYLFSSGRRRGLMLRWREDLTVEALTEAVESARDDLALAAPRKRTRKAGGDST